MTVALKPVWRKLDRLFFQEVAMDSREIFERAGTALLTGASLEGLPKIGRRAARLAIEEAIEALDAAALVGALHGV